MDTRFQSSFDAAKQAKDAGNTALKESQIKSACFQYKKVYLYLAEYLPPNLAPSYTASNKGADAGIPLDMLRKKDATKNPFDRLTPGQQQEMMYLYIVATNNLSQADLKLGRCREAALCATDVIRFCEWYASFFAAPGSDAAEKPVVALDKVEEAETKALLRRAAANAQLQSWSSVEEDLARLEAKKVKDAAIDALRADIEKGKAAEKVKQKKMAQRMFS